jgi:hypothetical protein
MEIRVVRAIAVLYVSMYEYYITLVEFYTVVVCDQILYVYSEYTQVVCLEGVKVSFRV